MTVTGMYFWLLICLYPFRIGIGFRQQIPVTFSHNEALSAMSLKITIQRCMVAKSNI